MPGSVNGHPAQGSVGRIGRLVLRSVLERKAAGDDSIDVVAVNDLTDNAFRDDVYITWAREQLEAAGVSPDSSSLLSGGLILGWVLVQSILVADELPGGLTRSNFVVAQRALVMTHPMFIEGIRFHMDGNRDSYFIEGGQYQQRDAAQQTWVPRSQVIDLDGQSTNCRWDATGAICE